MKKTIIALSAAALCFATACQQAPKAPSPALANDSTALAIAYVNTDSLLSAYEYAKVLSDELMSQSENKRTDLNQQLRVFQQDATEFERKVQNNGFLSMERAQSEQQRLQRKQAELQALDQQFQQELAQEQARMSGQLGDTLTNFLKEYAEGRYQLILSTNMMNGSVLYSAPGIDITAEVVEILNARYAEATKK